MGNLPGIVITGASGRMGQMLLRTVLASDKCRLVGAVERAGNQWVGRDVEDVGFDGDAAEHLDAAVDKLGVAGGVVAEDEDGARGGGGLLEWAVGKLEEVGDHGAAPEEAFHEFAGEILRVVGDGSGDEEVEPLREALRVVLHGCDELGWRGAIERGEDLLRPGRRKAAAIEPGDKLECGEVAAHGADEADEGGVLFGEGKRDELGAGVEQGLEEIGALGLAGAAGDRGRGGGEQEGVGELAVAAQGELGIGREAL